MRYFLSILPVFLLVIPGARPSAGQHFTEVGLQAGLGEAYHTTGLAAADYDGDGDLDVYVVAARQHDPSDPATWNRLFRNNGDGTFTDVTEQAGVRAEFVRGHRRSHMGNRFGASWADYDRDGDPDLFLTQVGPETLFQNMGDGTFIDVSDLAGINQGTETNDTTETVGATWWDFDGDGFLDLYVNNWRGVNRFYHNLEDGRFSEVSRELGVADSGRTWTAMPQDFNADGILDLYLANDFGPNTLYLGQSTGAFVEGTREYRVGDIGQSMGLALGDVNGDQRLDLYVTNIADYTYPNVLYVAVDPPPFEEVAEFLGVENSNWGWGTEFFDADLDGDVDLAAVNGFILENDTPNRLWLNQLRPSGRPGFLNHSAASGADDHAESRALLVFDYDADGDLDMMVATWNDRLKLYRNDVSGGSWLSIELRGDVSNPHGFGATVSISAGGHRQIRSHDGVDIFGQNIVPIHFGLGTATLVDTLEVRWPSGIVQRLVDIPAPGAITVVEQTQSSGHTPPPGGPGSLELFPNPVGDLLHVVFPSGRPGSSLALYDLLGRLVLSASSSGELIDVSHLSPGMYVARVEGASRVFLKH